jgi:hypothetical protein
VADGAVWIQHLISIKLENGILITARVEARF